jgi:L-alanine-DL-glutamate epimerase-like enolase superfamily enzyme
MKRHAKSSLSRRNLLKTASGAAAAAGLSFLAAPVRAQGWRREVTFNTNSAPSDLKITDMRACTVAANYDYPIIRIDTNQDVYGLGEVRDAGVKGIALVLKPHIVGRNPLDIAGILRSIRQFAGHGRMGGGYSAVDIALHDIAGKVFGVPVWRLLGNKRRDRVRIYADTTGHEDPQVYAERMRRRRDMGFTFFKMDLYTRLVRNHPGAIGPDGVATDKGLERLCELIAAVREVIGSEAPLGADHFGRLDVKDAIRYARAFEPYQLAWAEDMISWQDWRGHKAIKEATTTPILTGENTFGLEGGFKPMIENRAVDIIHPDPLTSGGVLETKEIADFAERFDIPTAVHYAGSPVGQMACVHMAATFGRFVAMENHALDMPWWQDLVTGVPKPIIKDGHITVPDGPGIGVELNEEVVKEHLRYPGYFEPTPEYDNYILRGFHSGGPWPHFDDDGNWCDSCISYQ